MAPPLIAATSIVTAAAKAPQKPKDRYVASVPHVPEAVLNRSSPEPAVESSICRPIANTTIERRPMTPPIRRILFPLPIITLPTIAKMPANATRARVTQQNQRFREITCDGGLASKLAEVE